MSRKPPNTPEPAWWAEARLLRPTTSAKQIAIILGKSYSAVLIALNPKSQSSEKPPGKRIRLQQRILAKAKAPRHLNGAPEGPTPQSPGACQTQRRKRQTPRSRSKSMSAPHLTGDTNLQLLRLAAGEKIRCRMANDRNRAERFC
jgi:hypothetical protein